MAGYKVPEKIVSMTVHHLYGIDMPGKYDTLDEYLEKQGFAFTADFLAEGFSPEDIEDAVNSESIAFAHWPKDVPKTDFYWKKDEKTIKELERLAEEAVKFCYGMDANQPIGGNFATVGAEMGSQQMAIAGLIYARENGKLREIAELDTGAGPLYVVKGGFSDKMFGLMFPD